jgi:hypothetical protein
MPQKLREAKDGHSWASTKNRTVDNTTFLVMGENLESPNSRGSVFVLYKNTRDNSCPKDALNPHGTMSCGLMDS